MTHEEAEPAPVRRLGSVRPDEGAAGGRSEIWGVARAALLLGGAIILVGWLIG